MTQVPLCPLVLKDASLCIHNIVLLSSKIISSIIYCERIRRYKINSLKLHFQTLLEMLSDFVSCF